MPSSNLIVIAEVVPQLMRQFVHYAYNKDPFSSQTWSRETKPLKWWTRLAKDSNSRLLARVAIKIFSISPSEICDERTASRLGWFNAARRSTMTPHHLVDSAKLYDFYVNGFNEDQNSTHKSRVHVSPVDQSSSLSNPAVHSAPSLMDLINSDNVEPMEAVDTAVLEAEWFSHPDPYDLDETERVDEALRPTTIIRTSDRFDISRYVKLNDPKLNDLIMNVDKLGPGALVKESEPVQGATAGKPGEWNIMDFLKPTAS